MQDELFADPSHHGVDFEFNRDVAEVFDDMVSRSVPLYQEFQRLAVELSVAAVEGHPGTIYDIGCSTGTTLIELCRALAQRRDVRLVGIEPAEEMRNKAGQKFDAELGVEAARIELRGEPIQRWEQFPDARAIVMLFVLQFVRPIDRPSILAACWKSLAPGGILLLGEKILADDSSLSRSYIDFYHRFKRRQGYSELEIAAKREALENVLVPFTDAENKRLLSAAGFSVVDTPLRWYNFGLYLGVKR